MAPIFKNAFQLLSIQNIWQLLRIKKKKKKKEISSRDKQVKLEAIDRKIKNVNNKISKAKVLPSRVRLVML